METRYQKPVGENPQIDTRCARWRVSFFIDELLRIDPIDEHAKDPRIRVVQLQDLSLSFNEVPIERGLEVWGVVTDVVFVDSE